MLDQQAGQDPFGKLLADQAKQASQPQDPFGKLLTEQQQPQDPFGKLLAEPQTPPKPIQPQSTTPDKAEIVRQAVLNSMPFGQAGAAIAEPVMSAISGMAGAAGGVLANLGSRILGKGQEKAKQAEQSVSQAMTYQPQTQAGQAVSGFVNKAISAPITVGDNLIDLITKDPVKREDLKLGFHTGIIALPLLSKWAKAGGISDAEYNGITQKIQEVQPGALAKPKRISTDVQTNWPGVPEEATTVPKEETPAGPITELKNAPIQQQMVDNDGIFSAIESRNADPQRIVDTKKGGTMPRTDAELAAVHDLKDINTPGITARALGRQRTVIDMLAQAFENPIRVLRGQPLLEGLYKAYKSAEKINNRTTAQSVGFINGLLDDLKNAGLDPKASEEKIRLYGLGREENGPAIAEYMGKRIPDIAELNPTELNIYGQLQQYFTSYFDRLNRARELAGQKPLPKQTNYLPWMRNLPSLVSDGVVDLINDDPQNVSQHLNAPSFVFESRNPKFLSQLNLNLFDQAKRYAITSENAINFTPIISKIRALTEPFDAPEGQVSMGDIAPRLRNYLLNWADTIGGKLYKSNEPYIAELIRKVANVGNKNIIASIMAGNVRIPAIHLARIVNNVAGLGFKYTLQGILESTDMDLWQDALEKSQVLEQRMRSVSDVSASDIYESTQTGGGKTGISRAMSAPGRLRDVITNATMQPTKFEDMAVAVSTWRGAYRQFLDRLAKQGIDRPGQMDINDAINYADRKTIELQGSASRGDVAPIQRSIGGKLVTTFQTYNINKFNLIKDFVKNKQVGRLLAGALTSQMIAALYEYVLHIKSPEPNIAGKVVEGVTKGQPAKKVMEGVGREAVEITPVIGSTLRYDTGGGQSNMMPVPIVQTGAGLVHAASDAWKAFTSLDPKKITMQDINTVLQAAGVPGVNEARKIYTRLKRGMSVYEAIVGTQLEQKIKKPKMPKGYNW